MNKQELIQQQQAYYTQALEVNKSLTGWDKIIHEVATQWVFSFNFQKIEEATAEELDDEKFIYRLLDVQAEIKKPTKRASEKDWDYWRLYVTHDFNHSSLNIPPTNEGEDRLGAAEKEIRLGKKNFENDSLNRHLFKTLTARWKYEERVNSSENPNYSPSIPTPTKYKWLEKAAIATVAVLTVACIGVVGTAICISNSYKTDNPCEQRNEKGHRMYDDNCKPL